MKKSLNFKDEYLYKYGLELAKIHNIPIKLFFNAKQRSINEYPIKEKYKNINKKILGYIDYLISNKPEIKHSTFIHGDFHYANVLWHNEKICGVLDWEYSGKGFKEQDIAWACILRPSQSFMNNVNDIEQFLKGYKSIGTYDKNKLKWCFINGYCHFYLMMGEEKEYRDKILKLLLDIEQSKF